MSGGVDSSLTAALLVEQGYDVTGVYMKNWSKSLPGFPCPWREDYMDAKRVAVQLGIDFQMLDFEQQYFDRVVQYMLDGFKAGITPNPDIMCNQEIKFKLFYDAAREQGADFIATGHYAQVQHSAERAEDNPKAKLLRAVDENKDQTYFLYRVNGEALEHTLFPLGAMTKPQVRSEAQKRGLATAGKKESMGICFVGKVGIKDFLTTYLSKPQKPSQQSARGLASSAQKANSEYLKAGAIIDQNGREIGQHDGAIFYTIGQRHGLNVGGGLPYYVTGKNMPKNEVYVTNDIADPNLWTKTVKITSAHWINSAPKDGQTLQVRTRHRAPLTKCKVFALENGDYQIELDEALRAQTPGQSAVLYNDQICLGGGIITG